LELFYIVCDIYHIFSKNFPLCLGQQQKLNVQGGFQMITNMQNILVAYDESEQSQKALDYALQLAKENKDLVLHLVTVYQPVLTIAYTYANYPVEQASYEQKMKMEEIVQNVKTELSIKTNNMIVAKAIEGSRQCNLPLCFHKRDRLNCNRKPRIKRS
jgi:hypothetical protein